MRRIVTLGVVLTMAVCLAHAVSAADHPPKEYNLFNGKNLDGWESVLVDPDTKQVDPDAKMEDVWSVKDGILICKGEPMGYLCTEKEFTNFKLIVEWRWAPGKEPGNSGVLMRITGKPMMLPNCVEAQLKSGSAGDMYGFQGFKIDGDPARKKEVPGHELAGDLVGVTKIEGNEKEPGQWNKYEITADEGTITLVVNGKEVNKAVNCDVRAGKIGLQSEGGEIHFRTVKLIPVGECPSEVILFNGKDLSGWTCHLRDPDAKMADTWSVADGVLRCAGQPIGYLKTKKEYTSYVLKLEWRWPEGSKPGNSGVLLRMVGPDKVWPKSVEAQLAHQAAGDIWNIDEFSMKADPARTRRRHTAKMKPSNEKPQGQWNEYEIILKGGDLTLKVNGEVQNAATDVEVVSGPIGLQSEGAPIEYRNIRLYTFDEAE